MEFIFERHPLHKAAQSGANSEYKVRRLLKEGCFVNGVDDDGYTPLHHAASKGNLSVVRVLISEFKADINIRTKSGETTLYRAASGGNPDVVRVLILEFGLMLMSLLMHVTVVRHYCMRPLQSTAWK